MSFLAALTTTSISILHSSLRPSPLLPPRQCRSPFLTLAARMQSRVLIARYTRAADIRFALSFPRRGIAPSSLHSRVPAPSGATKKNTRVSVAFGHGIALLVALATRPAAFFGFFLALRPSLSVSYRASVSLLPMKNISSQSLLSRARNAVDSLASFAMQLRLSPSILAQSPLALSRNCRFFFFPVRNARYHPLFHRAYRRSLSACFCLYSYLCFCRLLSV